MLWDLQQEELKKFEPLIDPIAKELGFSKGRGRSWLLNPEYKKVLVINLWQDKLIVSGRFFSFILKRELN